MVIGRTATFLSFVVGIALVPLLDMYKSIFTAINDVIAHLAPPITCVFTLGIFWGRASGRSAKYTMWLGSALGALLFTIKTLHAWQPARFARIPPFFYETPFMMMAFYMFCACVLLQVGLSCCCPSCPHEDPPAAVLGPSAGRPEIGRLAGAGRLSGAGRRGGRGHGRTVCSVPLTAAAAGGRNL